MQEKVKEFSPNISSSQTTEMQQLICFAISFKNRILNELASYHGVRS